MVEKRLLAYPDQAHNGKIGETTSVEMFLLRLSAVFADREALPGYHLMLPPLYNKTQLLEASLRTDNMLSYQYYSNLNQSTDNVRGAEFAPGVK